MEKIKSFKNAKEFQEMFGLNDFGTRKNKILLALLKDKNLWNFRKTSFEGSSFFNEIIYMRSQQNLFGSVVYHLSFRQPLASASAVKFDCEGFHFHNTKYSTDEYRGLCQDGDFTKIRVLIHENGGKVVVRKTSPGKVLRQVIKDSDLCWLPECVVNFLCEKFTETWRSYAERHVCKYSLVVNHDFESIYSSDSCDGDFKSCMVDDNFGSFYSTCVKAKAAALVDNETDLIVARCVIFTQVHNEETGEILRLAERQYSTNGNDALKRTLVDKLIEAGEIDGYKAVGAGCHSPKDFVRNNGEPLNNDMWIACNADPCSDEFPYMDSFKWYDFHKGIAYNYEAEGVTHTLEGTDGIAEEITITVYNCDGYEQEIPMHYFDYSDYSFICELNAYVDNSILRTCPMCGDVFVDAVGDLRYRSEEVHSEYLDEDFCCEDCMYTSVLKEFAESLVQCEVDPGDACGYGELRLMIDGRCYNVHEEVIDALRYFCIIDDKYREYHITESDLNRVA